MNVKITELGNKVMFKVTTKKYLSTADAQRLQMEYGYHPSGYGFYNVERVIFGEHNVYTWECRNSCD